MIMLSGERSCYNNKSGPMGGANNKCGRVGGFLCNLEHSRLEKLIFGEFCYDDNFMCDVRYLWSDCLLMGCKII